MTPGTKPRSARVAVAGRRAAYIFCCCTQAIPSVRRRGGRTRTMARTRRRD